MTPQAFIARWKDNDLTERAGAQAHFDDLCELLGVDKPRIPGEYQFEYGAKKASGGDGWADVWKRDHFGWENKKPGRDLKAALKQLTDYALDLGNPKLLVVSDRERIEIHTAFNGYPDEPRTILLNDIGLPENLQILRWVFTDPDKLRPLKSTAAITEEAAGKFAELAKTLRDRGLPPWPVAHFLIQCLFCMFAEDEGLLPGQVFTKLLKNAGDDTARAVGRLTGLFKAMRKGGDYGDHAIPHFNGGLFKTIEVPPLEKSDLAALATAASDMDWRAIEPAIFGTLFERGLNPEKRSQLGAHYTDVETIMRLIDPVITRPLTAEWEAAKPEIAADKTKTRKQAKNKFHGFLERLRNFRVLDPACGSGNFLYLALKALKDLEKRANLEAEALGLQRQIGIEVSPANVLGLELESYAAELARVTVWIGELQWMLRNGYPYAEKPILKPLDNIENRDALMNADNSEAEWPVADVIVGNPPFLGDKKMLGELGDEYVSRLRKLYKGRVPGGADLVTYWFEKARAQIAGGKLQRAGLVATNSIRGGANRKVLERILSDTIPDTGTNSGEPHGDDHIRYAQIRAEAGNGGIHNGASGGLNGSVQGGAGGATENDTALSGLPNESLLCGIEKRPDSVDSGSSDYPNGGYSGFNQTPVKLAIFDAWSDEAWVNEGAAVRVSLVCFALRDKGLPITLNGIPAAIIYPDLTGGDKTTSDLTSALPLPENKGYCFEGVKKYGSFDIPGSLARDWLKNSANPNNLPNSNVLRPWINATDIVRKDSDTWIIDFTGMRESEAALFERPFEHALEYVKPERVKDRNKKTRENWWLFERPRLEMRAKLSKLPRFIVTPVVSKHRIFAWRSSPTLAMNLLDIISRSDDTTFGVLHSRFHELWALGKCTWMGVGNDPRYTPTTTFETFPFPAGLLTDPDPDARFPEIAAAAKTLNQLRENWLNPEICVDWVQTPEEAAAGFPKRPVAKPGHEADVKKLTLTNLYNNPPAWLKNAHAALDKAVAAAYGWQDYGPEWTDEDILSRLLALNLARANNQAATPSTTEGEPDEDAETQGHEAPSAEPAPKRIRRAKPKTAD